MIMPKRSGALVAASLALCITCSAPALAQATRTWVSGVGDDANPCSRTAPCKTFQGTISKTATGGEINCIDSGGFGGFTITKSISVICDNIENGVLVSGTNGVTINVVGGMVTLSGFDLEGLGQASTTSGTNGVNVLNAAAVHVRNSKIRGFRNGYGINFQPQAGNGHLFVDNVTISESGNASTPSGGINLNPAASFTARATITNTQISNNLSIGIRADTTGIVGSSVIAVINNSVISNDNGGIQIKAPSGTGTVSMMITNSVIAHHATYGIIANGTATSAQARVSRSVITANGTGVFVLGAAALQSYGDNRLDGNGVDGTFTGAVLPGK